MVNLKDFPATPVSNPSIPLLVLPVDTPSVCKAGDNILDMSLDHTDNSAVLDRVLQIGVCVCVCKDAESELGKDIDPVKKHN